MSVIILGAITALLGSLPLLIKNLKAGITMLSVAFITLTVIIFNFCPSSHYLLGGFYGGMVVLLWLLSACIDGLIEETITWTAIPASIGILMLLVIDVQSWAMFRSQEYHDIIGQVETKTWTQDLQPTDPAHVRLVTPELAYYLATKQLGSAPGAVGSQFDIEESEMTLQIVNGELWYLAPLNYKGFLIWNSTAGSPGYIMVHGEDPKRPVVIKTGMTLKYLNSAFFGDLLERKLWKQYGAKYVLRDFSFEADDNYKPYWVITACSPTIGWEGLKVDGVIILDPATGTSQFYAVNQAPSWVDRVYPQNFVEEYAGWYGEFVHGWANSIGSKKDVFNAGKANIAYGADGNPDWVTELTSSGSGGASIHAALNGLLYTDARNGKTTLYTASGGTADSVIDLVDQKVSYRNLHGAMSQLYNVYGVMTAIVPLLGSSHSFQGVAFVDIKNMQVADGNDVNEALRKYQELLVSGGQSVSPESQHQLAEITGIVARFAAMTRGGDTSYYLYVSNYPHIFLGNPDLSASISLTQPGDLIHLRFIDSQEDVVPVEEFVNLSLPVKAKATQAKAQANRNNPEVNTSK
jgi:hypothetical protein